MCTSTPSKATSSLTQDRAPSCLGKFYTKHVLACQVQAIIDKECAFIGRVRIENVDGVNVPT